MASDEQLSQRAVIQFCVNIGKTPVQTMELMSRAAGKPSAARSLVYKWHKRYSDGRESIRDDDRCGRPTSKTRKSDVNLVKELVDVDRRITIHSICDELDMGYGTVQRILKEQLKMSRLSARWVPRLLKEHEVERRVQESKRFLARYKKNGHSFLSNIITTDETWLYFYDPESKQQSSQWKTNASPPPKKARISKSVGKHMFIVFFDIEGVILCHAVPKGQSVNANYYSKVLRRDLATAIRKKRPNGYNGQMIIHQDNAPAHASQEVQTTIQIQLEAEVLSHPPYSPDLAPCDFALFPKLKSELRGRQFSDIRELKMAAQTILYSYEEDWFQRVYLQWVERHRKCIAAGGVYFEKE